jgi:hypothetical protein
MPMSSAPITLRVSNFRSIERLEWSPHGVCLLAGPNGSGKTTTLKALSFLRSLFTLGHEAAFNQVDGVAFRRQGADATDHVEFEVSVSDITWKLRFPMSAQGLRGTYGEELRRGTNVVVRAAMFQEEWFLDGQRHPLDQAGRCCSKVLWDRGDADWMRPLVDALTGMRVHLAYGINEIHRVEPVTRSDSYLHPTGRNLWSVLANWKAAPSRYRGQFEWVIQETVKAFPDLLRTIEFDRGLPVLFSPGAADDTDGLPPNLQADGLLTGLCHLTAVVGAQPGSLVAFDEMENQLHPHAIRSLLEAMRDQAEKRDLTIVLTTHSPIVLNEFKGREDQVYVLERGWKGALPVRLDEVRDEAWLSHFALGDLYEREQFGAPKPLR